VQSEAFKDGASEIFDAVPNAGVIASLSARTTLAPLARTANGTIGGGAAGSARVWIRTPVALSVASALLVGVVAG
jgi:hypothetical protein